MLPEQLKEPLRGHLRSVRRVHRSDLDAGYGRTSLPYALERKYRSAPSEWLWQYVFPASHRVCQEDGDDIRTVQELLGRRSVRTTMIYTHVLNKGGMGVRSPADRL